ncbi:MAG: excinuclease ABC subunit UvrA [Chitinophagaceae bacterium]|nr:excinuclease ABC subunit UvrA [Chitinophagaceae bacterium]
MNKNVVKSADSIFVKGAKVHNLKNIDVEIPANQLVVITGVSGSGKSSLTMDTLYAEGQRRYAESLSAYARQFLSRMNKPDVEYIKGLRPAIAIEQKVISRTPRSTVGSMTEINDYLRLLFAKIGKTFSPVSGREVKRDDTEDVLACLKRFTAGSKTYILAPFKNHASRSVKEELNILLQKGFSRVLCFSKKKKDKPEALLIEELLDVAADNLQEKNVAYVLIDRLIVKEFKEEEIHRITDSVNTAFYEGDGEMALAVQTTDETGWEFYHFNHRFERDGIRFEPPTPELFSFNHPVGACPTCEGFSMVLGIDPDLVIPNKQLSVYEGAVAPWRGEVMDWWRKQFIKGASRLNFPIHKPVADLSEKQYNILWEGADGVYGIRDFFNDVESQLYKVQYRVLLSRYRGKTVCPDCNGYRLRKEALYVKIEGKHIGELCKMQIKDLKNWFDKLPEKLSEHEKQISLRICTEIQNRLQTLLQVGLGYLTPDRLANTLSGGESQRIQLTRSLGSHLTDSLYILDEPSIGLHPRDTARLIKVLKALRDLNNTVVVVEHDEMMMREADYIIDLGPLASYQGGEVVAAGTYHDILTHPKSITGKYLRKEYTIEPPAKVRSWKKSIIVEGARQHNLKNITVTFPLQVFCVICGVSGSGKTTLVKQILYPALKRLKGEAADKPGLHKKISGDWEWIDTIELVDQNPIGKSSRSNPVTYIKAYDSIRDLFAQQPLSKIRGFQSRHFSFNIDGGRCDTCKGEGEQIIEMQFLADVHLTCEACNGKRFKEEVLEVHYKGKNIAEVLDMSVDEALQFFKDEKQIIRSLQPLSDVGLGYIKLGQPATTLSGGEAQRVKLASFLGKGKSDRTSLFIFDEPTTGLHFHDIKKLLASFQALIEAGHSIIVIEHHPEIIRSADWVIELGPEAGDEGGYVVFEGVPAQLKQCKKSPTAPFI